MIGLDTNVLVRFLVQDDPVQTAMAQACIRRAIEQDDELFISDIVLCELCWVLETSYDQQRPVVASKLRELFHAKHLTFAAPDQLARALDAFESGQGDFADYLVREHAKAAGCEQVVTFDRALLRDSGFTSP